jgi:cysteine-rich repeat protein
MNTCTKCDDIPNIVFHNDRCVPCEVAMANCMTCTSNSSCIVCNVSTMGVNYVASPNFCVLCSTALSNCSTCTTHTLCSSCIDNTHAIVYIDIDNQICLPCSSFLAGCETCSDNATCLTCFANQTNYYVPSLFICRWCNTLFQFCKTCTRSSCLSCVSNQYALSNSSICKTCESYMPDCITCDTYATCLTCRRGRLLADRTACTPIHGCVEINIFNGNCSRCDPRGFDNNPLAGSCNCKPGYWVLGIYCTNVLGCTTMSQINDTIKCTSCNMTLKFVARNGNCVCADRYSLQGGVCTEICGDGYVVRAACDDGNLVNGDGCSSLCTV